MAFPPLSTNISFFLSTDIEVSNRHGHTCLMIACYKGHYKIANFLLSLKADINKKSVKGNTALHDCAESGSLDIFKMLILNGAKMEVDSYGKCCSIVQYYYVITTIHILCCTIILTVKIVLRNWVKICAKKKNRPRRVLQVGDK